MKSSQIKARVTLLFFLACVNFSYGQILLFEEVTIQSGIDHSFEPYQATFGGGTAVIDFDNDGWEDVYITGGLASDALYRNLGNGKFSDVIIGSGISSVTDTTVTQGVACADVNKDGWTDILITTIATFSDHVTPRAHDLLFINRGDGTFEDRSSAYGLDKLKTFSTGAAFGDINHDGFPDLYIANYFEGFPADLEEVHGSVLGTSGPSKDQFYINLNGNSFVDRSESYGLQHTGFGFGGFFTDYDNDRDLDLMVINDFGNLATPNLLYSNEYPKLQFENRSDEMQFNLAMNGMGIAKGDCNNDGWMDYFITNLTASPFYLNQGPNTPFVESSFELGSAFHSFLIPGQGHVVSVSWGAILFDYDHDGDVDLFFANGALNPSVMPNPNILLENINGHFRNVSNFSGLNDRAISRGAVTFDYDNDGDMDLLVVNQKPVENSGTVSNSYTKLYKNNASTGNWLKIKLNGKISDSHGIGARVEIFTSDSKMIREIDGGSSHESQNSTIAHFGVGSTTLIDTVKIKWIGGAEQILTKIPVNQTLLVEEDLDYLSTIENVDMILYPMPFNDNVNLSILFPEERTYTIDIMTMSGQLIDRIRSDVPRQRVFHNLELFGSPLPRGVYLFRLTWGNGDFIVKRGIKI